MATPQQILDQYSTRKHEAMSLVPDNGDLALVISDPTMPFAERQQRLETWIKVHQLQISQSESLGKVVEAAKALLDPENIRRALDAQAAWLQANPGQPLPDDYKIPQGIQTAYQQFREQLGRTKLTTAQADAAAQKLGAILHAAHIGTLPGDTKTVDQAAADGSLYGVLLNSGMSSEEIKSALGNSKDAAAVQSAFAEAWAKIKQSNAVARTPEDILADISAGRPVSTAEQNAYTEYRTKIVELTTKNYQKEIARIDAKYEEDIKHGQAVQGLALSQKLKESLARRSGLRTVDDFQKAVDEDKLGKYLLAAMYEDDVSKAEIDGFNESVEKWAKTNAAVHQARQQIEQAKADYLTMKEIEAKGEDASVAQRAKLVNLKKEIAAADLQAAQTKAATENMGTLKRLVESGKATSTEFETYWARMNTAIGAQTAAIGLQMTQLALPLLKKIIGPDGSLHMDGIFKSMGMGGLFGGGKGFSSLFHGGGSATGGLASALLSAEDIGKATGMDVKGAQALVGDIMPVIAASMEGGFGPAKVQAAVETVRPSIDAFTRKLNPTGRPTLGGQHRTVMAGAAKSPAPADQARTDVAANTASGSGNRVADYHPS